VNNEGCHDPVDTRCFRLALLYLSEQHAAATTGAQRALFLAAGETIWNVLIASNHFLLGRDVSEEVKLRLS
jgi:hypothetical protein